MLRYVPSISFFYACLIIFFSVAVFPHTALSANKSEIEQFLSLRHELIKTSKTEEQYTDIILLAKHKLAILHDQLSKIKSQINIRSQKKINLSKVLISLSRYPKSSPISSAKLPLSITRTQTLIRLVSRKLSDEINKLESDNRKYSNLKESITLETQRIALADKKLITLHQKIDQLITANKSKSDPKASVNPDSFEKMYEELREQNDQKRHSIYTLSIMLAPEERKSFKNRMPQSSFTSKRVSQSKIPLRDTNFPVYSSFTQNKLRLELPVFGEISGAFGEIDRIGLKSKGINITTQSRAKVFSSFDGKVLYASNFRNFGPILIIDHGDGFNTLMVGLDKIDVKTGQNLLKGEPVGVMKKLKLPERQPGPRLYLELRRYGKPVNPLAWLSPKRNAT